MRDQLALIFKLGQYKDIKSLQQGQVYCKNLSYYSRLEESTGDEKRGDILEGKFQLIECEVAMYEHKTDKLVLNLSKCTMKLTQNDADKMPIFCMVGIGFDDLEVKEETEEYSVYEFNPSTLLKEMLSEPYWDSALIIVKQQEFMNRIIKKVKDENLNINMKSVNYTDLKENYTDRIKDISENFKNIAFWKDNKYKNQYESRLAILNKEVEDNFILDIGDISDISILLDSKQLSEYAPKKYFVKKMHNTNQCKIYED